MMKFNDQDRSHVMLRFAQHDMGDGRMKFDKVIREIYQPLKVRISHDALLFKLTALFSRVAQRL